MMEYCKPPLTIDEQCEAKRLYGEWFKMNPGVKNPSDINSEAKFNYFVRIGLESFSLMQRARKCNVKKYGYPFEWTKPEYWEGKQ